MSQLFPRIRRAIAEGRVRLGDHALERMLERHVDIQETIDNIERATLLEDYALTRNEPRILVVQRESNGQLIYVVWEAPEHDTQEAVLVIVYHADR